MGKTLGESKGEIAKAVGEGRATADRAGAPIGEVLPSQIAGTISYTFRRPRGVVLGINPWNFPFSTPLRKAYTSTFIWQCDHSKTCHYLTRSTLNDARYCIRVFPKRPV